MILALWEIFTVSVFEGSYAMGMGRRVGERQQEMWIATESLPEMPQHVFYEKLNGILAEADFDPFVEELCAPFYAANVGRSSIPPGVYFRMLLIGYFEGIDAQRGIAWRCADSLSLKAFLGYQLNEATPDHSSLTRIRDRLPLEIHEQVFTFVLSLADDHQLLSNKTVAVDATLLEANAAMKSIVRKETGEDWKAYVRRLAAEEGVEINDDAELRKYDKTRKNKRVSNDEWESETDGDARIAKMKDGRTHLAYKAEHTIDLDSDFVLDARIYHASAADSATLLESLDAAQANLFDAGVYRPIEEVVADKGYHKNETLAACRRWRYWGLRTYIPEPSSPYERRWDDKPRGYRDAVYANRRRLRGARGKRLQKRRSEFVERSFAHVCETGGGRRSWLRGIEKVAKRYSITVAARNLGVLMRQLFGIGKPRCSGSAIGFVHCFQVTITTWWKALQRTDGILQITTPKTANSPRFATAI
jgi:transposase